MLSTKYRKYNNLGYTNLEAGPLMILEYRGMGYYKYRKEIEYIVQVLRYAFDHDIPTMEIDINSEKSCNIPFADAVIIRVDREFAGTHGEYSVEHNQDTDPLSGEIIVPQPDKDPNYDNTTGRLKEALIEIHITPDEDGKFNESKYRQTIAHELDHLRDDYEMRKSTNNAWSLLKVYVSGNIDIEYVNSRISSPVANLIYRLFIDTEWHALGSQMYMDMCGLYKERGNNLERSKASADMNGTDTMREYKIVRRQFEDLKDDPMLANKAIVYFPVWMEKSNAFRREPKKRADIMEAFRKDFIRICQMRLKDVFSRIVKAAGTFYDDIEDRDEFTFESYVRKSGDVVRMINEAVERVTSRPGDMGVPEDETGVIFGVVNESEIIPIKVRYNRFCFEKVMTF